MPRRPVSPPAPPSADAPTPRTVRCPTCSAPSLYGPANRWRPFCSERCKLQDLGAWASERFRVETRETDGADADPAVDDGNASPWTH